MDIKEVRRRVVCTTDEGIACGPVGSTAIEGEIVINDDGNVIYLHGQWVSEVGAEILVEATKESVYDIYEKIDVNSDEFEAMIEEIERIRKTVIDEDTAKGQYGNYIDELVTIITERVKSEGLCELASYEGDGEEEAFEVSVRYYEE